MNNLLAKFKEALRTFMQGRSGPDALSLVLLWIGLALYIIGLFPGMALMGLVSLAAYGVSLWRMLSRNVSARSLENQKYLTWKYKTKQSAQQSWNRLKNIRKFKYFKCSKCGALLRVPRNTGNVNITCSKCGNYFKAKA